MKALALFFALTAGSPCFAQVSYPPLDAASLNRVQCVWSYVAGSPTTIGATTTETSVATTPSVGSLTIPACATGTAFQIPIHVDGYYTAATVSPGTLTQRIKLNGVSVCQVVLGNLATSGAPNLGAHGDAYITVSAAGAVTCSGELGYQILATQEAPGYFSTVGTPTVTLGTAITLNYTGQWSAAVNTITATNLSATINR